MIIYNKIGMNINNYDLNNTLLICPNSYSRKVLECISDRKEIVDVKLMDLNQYKRNYYFDYDIKTIKYLVDNYNLSISNAKQIINNLYYIDENNKYDNKKLDELVKYKKELIENKLLYFNPLFKKEIEGRKIIVTGYGKIKKEDLNILDGQIIEEEIIDKEYDLYFFDDIEQEVEYLYNSIFDLLYEDNVDINKIFILNYNQDYESYFKRFNTYYPFKIELKNNDTILGSKLASEVVEMIDKNSKEEIFNYLNQYDNKLSRKIINIINKYPDYDLRQIKDYFIYDLGNSKITKDNYRNVVKCIDMNTDINDDDHVFLIGFNEQVPTLKKDDDYISDELKNRLGLSDSESQNDLIRYNFKAYLSNIKNLYLSYSGKSPFNTYNKNLLFDKINIKQYHSNNNYSDKINELRYSYSLDRFDKYGIQDDEVSVLDKYHDIDFGKYNNSFSGLDDKQLDNINKVSLSYSSMDEFYKCQFKYYLEYILKLSENDDNFNTKLGTLCHDVLRQYYEKNDFDFENSWNESLSKFDIEDEKEAFFLNKIKNELKQDIEIISKQDKDSDLSNHVCEEKFKYDLDDSISFNGTIDKLNYKKENDETIVSVVDYKSGAYAAIKEKLFPYGLSLQLPSYMYLLSKDDRYNKNLKYAGFYLQYLVNNDIKYDLNKNIDDIKKESMKLKGYTSDVLDRAVLVDKNIEQGSSDNIHALRLKKDGSFHANSSVMSDDEINELIDLVDEKIRYAGNSILNGDFRINPKQIDKKNESCEHCPYADICFKRNDDLVSINTRKDAEE